MAALCLLPPAVIDPLLLPAVIFFSGEIWKSLAVENSRRLTFKKNERRLLNRQPCTRKVPVYEELVHVTDFPDWVVDAEKSLKSHIYDDKGGNPKQNGDEYSIH